MQTVVRPGGETLAHQWRGESELIPLSSGHSMDDAIVNKLEQRLGRLHAKQRLGIEKDHEAQIFG